MCHLKVEITVNEPKMLSSEDSLIIYGDEPFAATAHVYSLAEIVTKKLRALLQSYARLKARGWGASSVCRDYYDLWLVFGSMGFTSEDIPGLKSQKCAARKILLQSPQEFFAPELVRSAQSEWQAQLAPFTTETPMPDQVIESVKRTVLERWQS